MHQKYQRKLRKLLCSVSIMGCMAVSTLSLAQGESCSSGRLRLFEGEKSIHRFLAFWEKNRFVKVCGITSDGRSVARFGAHVVYFRDGEERSQIIEPQANTNKIKACYFLDGNRFRLVISDTFGERQSTVIYDYDFCVVLE